MLLLGSHVASWTLWPTGPMWTVRTAPLEAEPTLSCYQNGTVWYCAEDADLRADPDDSY